MTTLLHDASRQLSTRPADEHFESFDALRNSADLSLANGREHVVDPRQIIFREDASAPGGIGVSLSDEYPTVRLSWHSARQLADLAGSKPSFVFERLSPRTAATALNEAIRRGESQRVKALIEKSPTGAPKLRAITSEAYHRVWDAQLYESIDRWLVPHGFFPAHPTINTDAQRNNIMGNNKPALFRGDLDSFAFFMTDKGDQGPGDRPMRRGAFVYNSEVGTCSFGFARFVFDDVCANFLIWGAKAVRRLRLVHRCAEGRGILRRFDAELRECSPQLQLMELDALQKAAETIFAPDRDKALSRLCTQFGTTQKDGQAAIAAAGLAENRGLTELSHQWVANGLTSMAKDTRFAGRMVELATLGGDVVLAAGGGA